MRCDRCRIIFEKYDDDDITICLQTGDKKYEDRKLYSGLNLCRACRCSYACVVSDWIKEKRDEELYNCDPSKNVECSKESCHLNGGDCFLTLNELYSKGENNV